MLARSGESSPGADVAAVSPVPVLMWQGRPLGAMATFARLARSREGRRAAWEHAACMVPGLCAAWGWPMACGVLVGAGPLSARSARLTSFRCRSSSSQICASNLNITAVNALQSIAAANRPIAAAARLEHSKARIGPGAAHSRRLAQRNNNSQTQQ